MNVQHLSDEVLKSLLQDEHFDAPPQDIEAHLDTCPACRSRLDSFAAEDDWLQPYRASLSDHYRSATCEHAQRSKSSPTPGEVSLPDFERSAIDSMLQQILTPSIHGDNLGRLGKYEVEEILGFGGMGIVLKAFDQELHRPVAIKLIVPRLVQNGLAKQRFAREARAAATVLHPNVIAIHTIDETQGIPWFVMPLVAGPTLEELVTEHGALPEKEIVRIGLQIASGLAAAHSHGVIHRDIKPANILVDNLVNRIVITDFGLARQHADTMVTRTGVLTGTLHYMSPEQSRGEDLDGRSDLFSLGALLYFLATGRVPFESETSVGVLHRVANKPHADVRRENPEISSTLASTIDMLLAKDAGKRFQSAADLEQFLSKLVSYQNQPTQHALPRVPATTAKWTQAGLLAATLLIVGGGLLAGYLLNSPATPEPLSPESLWASIQEDYQLSIPARFDQELSQLSAAVAQLDSELSESIRQEDQQLLLEIEALESRIRSASQGLGEQ